MNASSISASEREHRAFPFRGKTIAITGASSGIARSLADYLASRGARLSLCDTNWDALQAVRDALTDAYSTPVLATRVDVSSRAEVDAWISSTLAWTEGGEGSGGGKLHGAANVAGTIGSGRSSRKIVDAEDADWELITNVNARGTFNCMRAQLKVMEDGGAVVNASSIAGHEGRPCAGPYTASKHAIVGLTRTAAKEVGERGIRVNAVAPGYVDTPMMVYIEEEVKATALARVGKPKEVASLIAFLLGDESKFITGAVYSIDGGWHC